MSVYVAENLGSFATKIKGNLHTTMVILQKIWANFPPNVRSLNSPYYKGDIAENWEHLPPKWKESTFSILLTKQTLQKIWAH